MNTQFDDRVRVPSELSVVIMTIEIRTEPLSQEVNGHHGTGHEIATHVAAAVHQGKQPADGVSQTGVKVEDAQSQSQNDGAQKDHYSVFTGAQKRAIIISGSVLTLVSFMGSTMYYPALNQISGDLHVSNSEINITVTIYLITQGVVPVFIAEFAEKAGRRPAYLVCFLFTIVANLGLALQNNFYALLFLRIVQAAGSCGTITQGLVGDIIVSAERGQYMAYTTVTTIFGPSVSPILGGALSQYEGWHWIFWFLLILAVATFIPFALFLPETYRHVVHDGSIPPPTPCANVSDTIRHRNRRSLGLLVDAEKVASLQKEYKLAMPVPTKTVAVLTDRASALFLTTSSLALASSYAILTPLSANFQSIYAFSSLQVSLVSLAMGIGNITSGFSTGRFLDWNFRRMARKHNIPLEKQKQVDLSLFPLEQARLQVGLPIMLVAVASVLTYGWTLRADIPSAVPIVFTFVSGYGIMGTYQVLSVLMADSHPKNFAVAAAARNVFSCLIGAAASAAVQPMALRIGNGLTYTIFALLLLGSAAGPTWALKFGMARRERKAGPTPSGND